FHGSMAEQLRQKGLADPPHPASLVEGLPGDLAGICAGLVSRDRDWRHEAWAGLLALRPSQAAADSSARTHRGASDSVFVGRESAFETLGRGFSILQSGTPASLLVHGPSGIGKTALVRRFLERLPAAVVVLRGRCYEHEAVPYRALDGIIDSLGQY